MKKIGESFFYSLINSGAFLPLIIFFAISFLNQIAFIQKTVYIFYWQVIIAFFSGYALDLCVFLFVTLILSFLSNKFNLLKKNFTLVLYSFSLLPILDYLYLNATIQRFNWIVLRFVNYHSIKGYLGNITPPAFCFLLIFALTITYCFNVSVKKKALLVVSTFKPLIALVIFLFFVSFFLSAVKVPIESNFTGHIKTAEGKNRVLRDLSLGSISNFILSARTNTKAYTYQPYSSNEIALLKNLGMLPPTINKPTNKKVYFDRVVIIVLESFALEYLHSFNQNIPKSASSYIDYLIDNYPHCKNYYTSDFPSLEGFNAILSSRIPLKTEGLILQHYNFAHSFESRHRNSTVFFRGTSRYYGGEDVVIQKVFGFNKLIGYEDLALNYDKPPFYAWGFNDSFLFKEALLEMNRKKNKEYLIVIKLLNQHQPISGRISNGENIIAEIAANKSDIVKAVFDADLLIKDFVQSIEKNGLFDERTLIVVTADHYPPLGYGHKDIVDYDFQLGRLPLIFISKQPEVFKRLNKDRICCQLDLAPTLCDLTGLNIPRAYLGSSMLNNESKSRSIGILNREALYVKTDLIEFSESLISPATSTTAIQKWINNLYVDPPPE